MGILVWIVSTSSGEEAKPDPRKNGDVALLIKQLGSDQFSQREEAGRSLELLGSSALPCLRKAAQDNDLEIGRRANAIIHRIERRVENARLNHTRKIRLVYKDTPVIDAIEDFGRISGFSLQIEGNRSRIENRKITLDTGLVTFWEAVDQFCRKAHLVECDSDLLKRFEQIVMDPERLNKVAMWSWSFYDYYKEPIGYDSPVIFKDGKPRNVSTCYTGALRIRAVKETRVEKSRERGSSEQTRAKGEEGLLYLEVSPEPNLGWQCILKMHITSLTDESGKELSLPAPYYKEETDFQSPYDDDVFSINDRESKPPKVVPHPLSKQVSFRVFRPQGAGRILRTVQGVVSGAILTPPQPLIQIDNILNASGKTFPGPDGESVKVVEVNRSKEGSVALKLLISPPINDPEGSKPMVSAWVGGQMRLRRAIMTGQVADKNELSLTGQELSLVDVKGQAFQLTHAKVRANEDNTALEYIVEFQPHTCLTVPNRLIYCGQRRLVMDVPFTLRDVPMP